MSPWEWTDFNPIEETVNVANMVEKSRDNRRMTLNLADYTESMTALHYILTETPLNKAAESAAELPSFTDKQLKAGLRTPWTAEQIGRLLVKYESEWYADESLSKWNEIDSLYQKQYDQKKQSIADELTQANITKPAERDYAMQILDKSYQQQTDEWQIEKLQRIKPSLWWSEVAKGQAAQAVQASTKTEGNADKAPEPVLSNLCANGKVWHLHPEGLVSIYTKLSVIDVESFIFEYKKRHKDFSIGSDSVNYSSELNLRAVLDEINKFYLLTDEFKPNKYKLAYMFATARHEAYYYLSGEFFSKKPEIGSLEYFNKYDPVLASTEALRKKAIKNGNIAEGDGYKYRGRGLVHLTWKNNYSLASKQFDVDFVNQPDKAADFKYSVPIMIWGMEKGIFTTKKLSDYINSKNIDYENARRIINGTDRKEEIANNARIFEEILSKSISVVEEF